MANKFNRFQPVHVSGVSKTRPNMALTVREINQRFVQGKSVPQAKTPIHEPALDNLQNPMRRPYCDLIDVAEYSAELTERLNQSEGLLTEKKKEFLKNMQQFQQESRQALLNELKNQTS